MSYDFAAERPGIFTERGTPTLMLIRDHVKALLATSGAVRMQEAISVATGDSWTLLACVDYMVERGELCEVPQQGIAAQYRIFVAGNR